MLARGYIRVSMLKPKRTLARLLQQVLGYVVVSAALVGVAVLAGGMISMIVQSLLQMVAG